MGMTGRIVEDPKFVTDDDDITYRTARVLLPNGRKATAFFHDTPGDWAAYRKNDRVKLSSNDPTNDGASGWTIIGKFTDDFEPIDEKNREIHGPKDGNLVLRSRNDLDIDAAGTVELGTGDSGDKSAIAINSESLADAEALHDFMDPNPTATWGKILVKINAVLSGGITEDIAALILEHAAATPDAKGAENVNAKPEAGV